ncbi:MAG: hypothetical protein WA127_08335 [Methanothrix sp.]
MAGGDQESPISENMLFDKVLEIPASKIPAQESPISKNMLFDRVRPGPLIVVVNNQQSNSYLL